MIVSINPAVLPFTAELEFPRGLAKGEAITLMIGEGDIESFPRADDIRVDPITRILHIGRKYNTDKKDDTQNLALQKIECNKCAESFSSGAELSKHKRLCSQSSICKAVIDINGQNFLVELNTKQKNSQQIELNIFQGVHTATLIQNVTEPEKIYLSCWSTVPQSFYDDCIQLASKLLTRNASSDSESMLTINSQSTVISNKVKITTLDLECASTVMKETSFTSLFDEFEHFLSNATGTSEASQSTNRDDLESVRVEKCLGKSSQTGGEFSDKETTRSAEERYPTRKKRRKKISEEEELSVTADVPTNSTDGGSSQTYEAEEHEPPPNGRLFCQLCLKINRKVRFSNAQSLQVHMTNNHSVEVVETPECSKCSKKFVSSEALLLHEKKCNPKFPKRCQVCDKSFAMGLHRDRHLREIHGIIKEHSCGICGQKYQSEKHRDWHVVTKHKDSLSAEEIERLGMEEIQCTLCDFRSYSSKGMQVHRQREHIENEKSFRCPACGVGDDSLAGIQHHISEKHGSDDRWWICQYCNRTFYRGNTDDIEMHSEHHAKNSGSVCAHCNKVFETPTIMLDHITRNHNDKQPMPYICDICDQGSENYRDLLKHMLKHNPFKTSLYKLQRQHIVKRNIEEGILPLKKESKTKISENVYTCDVCGKLFDLEASLTAHNIVFHKDPGKEFYICPVCGKAFRQHHLAYHLRLHSGERPHKCRYCEARFHTIASCSDHEVVKHTYDYKLYCPVCNKGFVSRAKTWQHLIRFHKESPQDAEKLLPPMTSKVKSILQKRRQTEEIKQFIENTSDGPSGHHIKRSNRSQKTDSESNGDESTSEIPEMEINDETLEEGEIVEMKEIGDEVVEISNVVTPGVSLDYTQSDSGLHYYRLVYADGTQTTVPVAPGDQVVIEDEDGNQQILDPSTSDQITLETE